MADSTERDQPALPSRELADAYTELQNILIAGPDVTEFFEQVALLAASVVAGTSCGITIRRDNEIATIATSDPFAATLDEVQYGRGQGPCLQALHTGEIVAVVDLADEDRWGNYRAHALAYGVRSSLSLPLVVDGETLGALNLYAKQPDRFDADAAAVCVAFARQAATALTLVLRNTDQILMQANLRAGLASRAIIDQAIGILMGLHGTNAADSFAVLRNTSQNTNRKLRDVAYELVETITGEPPQHPRPFNDPR